MLIAENIARLRAELPAGVELVAVSKTRPAADVAAAYAAGQHVFGENRPQEMASKRAELLAMGVSSGSGGDSDAFADVHWHQIGHLQTNKVKLIAPFVEMVHSGDSARLLREISGRAVAAGRVIDVLLEIRIAREVSKEGWDWPELLAWIDTGEWLELPGIRLRGVMGVATFTDDAAVVRSEFCFLRDCFETLKVKLFNFSGSENGAEVKSFNCISAGMSDDFRIALQCGSTMVRIGSDIFGARDPKSASQ